jgi:hypothetical protein
MIMHHVVFTHPLAWLTGDRAGRVEPPPIRHLSPASTLQRRSTEHRRPPHKIRSHIRWLCPRTYISCPAARCKSQVFTHSLSLPRSPTPTSCTRPSLSLPSRLRPLLSRCSSVLAHMHALRAMLSVDPSSLVLRYSASSTARTLRESARTRP